MSSLPYIPALALLLLTSCGPQAPQNTGFWRGAWAIDGEALRGDEGLGALPPSARPLAEALLIELAPQIRYEFAADRFIYARPQGRVEVPCAVTEREGRAEVELEGGRVLELRPVEGGLIITEGALTLPLRRAEAGRG
ncbi:hypothetical protein KKF91_16520 [Myxococcota bacterium]|nr:hypothetical protein [Myxococcota bacterium]MBU1432141.1 hypothetical protein [Myxococcota bacterium]MBU1897967.1 hypothetical protein [Myxococcota bacterium]